MDATPPRLLIVGTGRLAETLARASLRHAPAWEIGVTGRNGAARDRLIAVLPGLKAADAAFAGTADLVVLAVAPEAYRSVAATIAPAIRREAAVVSVTNGVALDDIGDWLANPVVKVIPTIAQTVGRGVTLIVRGPRAGDRDIARVTAWLERFSLPMEIDAADTRVASNVAGSGVAILARFARAFVDANAVRARTLEQTTLRRMMAETMAAVAALIARGESPEDIIDATATPGGMTEAAIEASGPLFDEACLIAVEATFARQAALRSETA